jgi:hypothetical protein
MVLVQLRRCEQLGGVDFKGCRCVRVGSSPNHVKSQLYSLEQIASVQAVEYVSQQLALVPFMGWGGKCRTCTDCTKASAHWCKATKLAVLCAYCLGLIGLRIED